MRPWRDPFDDAPPGAVFLIRDPTAPDRVRFTARWLERALPGLDWRAHLFVLGGDDAVRWCDALARVAVGFLKRHGFSTLYLHPLIGLRPAAERGRDRAEWDRLLAPVQPFKQRAYDEQSEARLLLLPIIAPPGDATAAAALDAAAFFRARFAKPSMLVGASSPAELRGGVADEVRLYLSPRDDPDPAEAARQLRINHVFETVLDRIEEGDEELLAPCRRHVVADERRGEVFPCLLSWEDGQAAARLDDEQGVRFGAPPADRCAVCVGQAALQMRDNLTANGREHEGRRVAFKLALAAAEQGNNKLAADLAHLAFELSGTDPDRSAALIHEGLCRRLLNQLQAAEDALVLALEHTDDPGLVAFYRGEVQFTWRDYIEAIDRFEEALEAGTAAVPPEDICYQAALSHINIEEYPEARGYLERSLRPGQQSAPIRFYQGICELGEGRVEAAKEKFEEALAIGPDPEDLGRVLFYIGTCHKELGQYDEAIAELLRAIEADPEDLANHNLIGFCYYKTQRHEEAVACFRRAVEIDPRSGIDWANLGSNLRDLGRIDEAIDMYEKALKLDPSITFARDNLAILKRGDPPA